MASELYEKAKIADDFFQRMKKRGQETRTVPCTSNSETAKLMRGWSGWINNEFNNLTKQQVFLGQYGLTLAGPGVRVPKYTVTPDPESHSVTIQLDHQDDTCYEQLDILGSANGFFQKTIFLPDQDKETGACYVVPHAVFEWDNQHKLGFAMEDVALEALGLSIVAKQSILASCDDTTTISTMTVEKIESRRAAMDAVSVVRDPSFRKNITVIERALESERPDAYTKLEKIQPIQELGNWSRAYFAAHPEYQDVVATAVREKIGTRYLSLEGDAYRSSIGAAHQVSVGGRLIDVTPALPTGKSEPELTLVVETNNQETFEPEISFLPMSRISSFNF